MDVFFIFIRSPSAYEFLRTQQILPLPCFRTVRRYLSQVKSECGFDEKFFQLLKKKISILSNEQRHGMLLFDEIMLRESIHVNSSTLTYSGLENLGNNPQDQNTNLKANHGLVFMFQSLSANFCQPIGVFSSKGTVSGLKLYPMIIYLCIILLNLTFCLCKLVSMCL